MYRAPRANSTQPVRRTASRCSSGLCFQASYGCPWRWPTGRFRAARSGQRLSAPGRWPPVTCRRWRSA